ncbi:TonB-dependent receptor [Zunongwangia sp. SCSIO 43204]|uniref:TonB-dependent receptor n=1 Tax=unclassified Zunongwangia TaxID=2632541 RepID=UPI001CA81ECA|nr:carboxypeptidase-like regulatory domain-containing protein [Zunongwangia sp. SCSIO 43204]UAB84360.1 TonB-dependent receptor [Zunongwangia sp. SCSIO 43204]
MAKGYRTLLLFFIFFLFLLWSVNSQVIIEGKVTDSSNKPLENASIVLSNSENEIIDYLYTDNTGEFKFNISPTNLISDSYDIAVNLLGFEEHIQKVALNTGKKRYTLSFILQDKIEHLNEVVLKPDEKISTNGNVTTLKTAPFIDQSEENVEDVLKKLPGIEVLEDGTIKAHGKFIKKLMIDGDDMFANDYQVLSKNLDAKTLDAVQIIDNFQDNPVLARVLDSDDVALNLELKDEFKNVWFGNASLGAGLEERIRGTANIGLLRKKIKFFYLGDYNNLGNKAVDQLKGTPSSLNLTSAYREVEIEPEIESVFSINKNESQILKDDQSIFNKAFLNSIGLVTKIEKDIEIRATGSFAQDNQRQLFYSRSIFNVEENPVEYIEDSDTDHKNSIGSGELEIKYTGGERSYLRNLFSYKNQPEKFDNQLIFNNNSVNQDLNKKEYALYNHLNYSYALGKNTVLHNYTYVGQTQLSQDATINSLGLNNFFDFTKKAKIYQNNKDELNVFGINNNLFSEFGNFTNRLSLGYEIFEEDRQTKLSSPSENFEVDSLKNDLNYKRRTFNLKESIGYKFSEKAKLTLGISMERLDLTTDSNEKEKWIFNPQIDLDLRKLKIGRFVFGYENTYAVPDSHLLFQNYQLNTYNSLVRGTNTIYLVEKDVYKFYYKWANELESQALTFRIKYDDFKGNYSTTNQIGENLRFFSYQVIEGSNRISANLDFTSFFDDLNLSTNLRTSQNWGIQPIQANSQDFNDLKTYSSNYLISGTTYFKIPLNFRFRFNLNLSESDYNNVISKTQWSNYSLALNYKLSEKWNLNIENDYYKMPNNSYYFLNSTLKFQPDSNFSYKLFFNNLGNEMNFSTVVIDEFTTYESSIRLLPRYLFLSVKYKF